MADDSPVKLTGIWEDGRNVVLRHTQDVEPVLDANKRLYNEDGDGWSPSRELRRVASIPIAVYYQWLQEGIDLFNPDHKEAVRRKLNDPEYRYLRTAPGRF